MEVGKDITDQNVEKKEGQSVKRENYFLFFSLKSLFIAIFRVEMVSVIFSHYPNNAQPPTIQKYEWKPIEIYGH